MRKEKTTPYMQSLPSNVTKRDSNTGDCTQGQKIKMKSYTNGNLPDLPNIKRYIESQLRT